tara:strand:+ start:135 stop:617 length:483 start_codon:yes stop_codon:yes gene_type:complete
MSVKSYLKRCEEFSICSQVGDRAGLVFVEPAVDRMTQFQIAVKGSGRWSNIFNSDFEVANANEVKFVSMKQYMGQTTIFESYEPFLMYGFNTLSKNQDWDGKLINESFGGNDKSWLICFDGRPVINGVELARMDYAKLENKHYDVDIKDGLVGVFKKNEI